MNQIKKEDKEMLDWCDSVASVVADAMIDADLIKKDNFKTAVEIASEEIYVRLLLNDFPPFYKPKRD